MKWDISKIQNDIWFLISIIFFSERKKLMHIVIVTEAKRWSHFLPDSLCELSKTDTWSLGIHWSNEITSSDAQNSIEGHGDEFFTTFNHDMRGRLCIVSAARCGPKCAEANAGLAIQKATRVAYLPTGGTTMWPSEVATESGEKVETWYLGSHNVTKIAHELLACKTFLFSQSSDSQMLQQNQEIEPMHDLMLPRFCAANCRTCIFSSCSAMSSQCFAKVDCLEWTRTV